MILVLVGEAFLVATKEAASRRTRMPILFVRVRGDIPALGVKDYLPNYKPCEVEDLRPSFRCPVYTIETLCCMNQIAGAIAPCL